MGAFQPARCITIFALGAVAAMTSSVCLGANRHPTSPYSVWARPPSYYYGQIRQSDPPVLIVAGVVSQSGRALHDIDPSDDNRIWVFGWQMMPTRWALLTQIKVPVMFLHTVRVFHAHGDKTRQLELDTGGVDWSGVEIVGFRGPDYTPKILLDIGDRFESVTVHAGRQGTTVTEHWQVRAILMYRRAEPLPPILHGHVFARRVYRYDPHRDTYKAVTGFIPDRELERHLTPRQWATRRKQIAALLQSERE